MPEGILRTELVQNPEVMPYNRLRRHTHYQMAKDSCGLDEAAPNVFGIFRNRLLQLLRPATTGLPARACGPVGARAATDWACVHCGRSPWRCDGRHVGRGPASGQTGRCGAVAMLTSRWRVKDWRAAGRLHRLGSAGLAFGYLAYVGPRRRCSGGRRSRQMT
jgi:hypothetical protein